MRSCQFTFEIESVEGSKRVLSSLKPFLFFFDDTFFLKEDTESSLDHSFEQLPNVACFGKVLENCKKSQTIYGWLEWVCLELKPFAFVESEYTRKFSKFGIISVKTFEKYMHLISNRVEREITKKTTNKLFIPATIPVDR